MSPLRTRMSHEPSQAQISCFSARQVRCLVLSQQAFEQQLGPLSALIDEERIKREQKSTVPMLQVILLRI